MSAREESEGAVAVLIIGSVMPVCVGATVAESAAMSEGAAVILGADFSTPGHCSCLGLLRGIDGWLSFTA